MRNAGQMTIGRMHPRLLKPEPACENAGTDYTFDVITNKLEALMQTAQGKYTKWKTSLINQFLLNEEVHVYDFANGKPMVCSLFNGVPCCIPRDDLYGRSEHLSEDVKNWIKVLQTQSKKAKKINCPETFGLVHNGENACLLFEYDATCDGKFFTALMKPLTK